MCRLFLLAVLALVIGPTSKAFAAADCHAICSAPGHDYEDCKRKCKEREELSREPERHDWRDGRAERERQQMREREEFLKRTHWQCEQGDREACRIHHLYRECEHGDNYACDEVNRERYHERH